MEAVIKLRPEELTDQFIEQLKLMAKDSNSVEIRLSGVDALNNLTPQEIDERIKLFSDEKTISFTMEEFEAYVKKLVPQT